MFFEIVKKRFNESSKVKRVVDFVCLFALVVSFVFDMPVIHGLGDAVGPVPFYLWIFTIVFFVAVFGVFWLGFRYMKGIKIDKYAGLRWRFYFFSYFFLEYLLLKHLGLWR